MSLLHSRFYILNSARRGQSIIEVLVATAVGSIMIVAAVGLISPALRGNQDVTRIQTGAAIAKEMIEHVRVWAEADWHNVSNLATTSANPYFIVPGSSFKIATGTESVVSAPSNGLVGHWKLDEGVVTNALDSASGNHGSSTGGIAATSSCQLAGCRNFDGVNGLVTIPDSSSLDVAGAITLSIWLKTSSSSDYSGLINKAFGNNGYQFGLSNNGGVRADFYNGATYITPSHAANIENGQWHHVVTTYDGTTARIYVDGNPGASASGVGFVTTNNASLLIGQDACCAGRYFSGYLDDARVYNRALSQDEILDLYSGMVLSRSFYLESVNRDGSDNISAGAGTWDPSTLKITVNYNWEGGTTSTMVSYLTRAANKVYRQTDWFSGANQDGPQTSTNSKFATSSNLDWTSSPGSLQVVLPED